MALLLLPKASFAYPGAKAKEPIVQLAKIVFKMRGGKKSLKSKGLKLVKGYWLLSY